MAKRRPSGDGMVRKREDGRREGRIVVGHKDNGDSILPLYLRRYSEGADRQAPAAHRPLPGSGLDGVEPDDYERIVIGGWTAGWKISPGPYGPTPWPDTVGRWSGTSSPIWETSLSPRSRGKTFKGYTTHWLSAETGTPARDWCAPRQVDSEIIYILRMKILPAYHMVLGAMQPADGHGLP